MTEHQSIAAERPQGVASAERSRHNWTQRLGGAGLALLIAGGGVFAGKELSGSGGSSRENPNTPIDACADSVLENVAANPTEYDLNAFLPKNVDTKVNKDFSELDTREAINSLFNTDGPLGHKIDKGSLAAIMSAVVKPSHDGDVVSASHDYVGTFHDQLAAYNSAQGTETAEGDCVVAYSTLVQTGEKTNNWTQSGEAVTLLSAERDESNNPVDLRLVQGVTVENQKGILFKLPGAVGDLDGFTEVFWEIATGKLYVKGVVSTPQAGKAGTNNTGGAQGGQGGGGQGQPGGGPGGCQGVGPTCPGGGPGGPGGGGGGGGGGETTTTTRPPTTTTTQPKGEETDPPLPPPGF